VCCFYPSQSNRGKEKEKEEEEEEEEEEREERELIMGKWKQQRAVTLV
jgi:hypothetical protein